MGQMPENAANSRARATVKVDAALEKLMMSVYIGFERLTVIVLVVKPGLDCKERSGGLGGEQDCLV